jgi:hypothetical protein
MDLRQGMSAIDAHHLQQYCTGFRFLEGFLKGLYDITTYYHLQV